MSTPKQPETLEEMIITLEDATWKVMEDNATDLQRFLTDDCIFLFAAGLKLSRDSEPTLRESLKSEAYVPWSSHKMSDIEITLIGGEGAIISYKVVATRPAIDGSEEEDEFTALVSSTWRRDEDSGHLLLCHSQQTPF
jgi:ketosteroid isomerase-like protein